VRVPAALVFVVALACRPTQDVAVDAPASIAYAAVVQLDGEDVVAATPLVRWAPSEGLPVFVDGARRHVVVGFTEAQLTLADGDGPFTEPLRSAESRCASALPAPTWAADPVGASVDPTTVPRLTASWLEDICTPPDPAAIWVENRCTARPCALEVVETAGCLHTYSLARCDGPELFVSRRDDGTLCVDATADLAECPFTLHDAVSGPAPYTVERATIATPLPVTMSERPVPADRRAGVLVDFAFVEDHMLVATRTTVPQDCADPNAARRLLVVDDDLVVQDTVEVTGCLDRLASTPAGVIGLVADGGRWHVATYDAAGTRTATAAFPQIEVNVAEYRAVDLLVADTTAYAVFGARETAPVEFRFLAVELDTRTLLSSRIFNRTEPREPWVATLRGTHLVVAGVEQQSFVDIDLVAGGASATALPHDFTSADINDLYAAGSTVAVALRQAVHVVGERKLRRPMFTNNDAVAIHGWPQDRLLIVALEYVLPPMITELTFYDERTDRLLPGKWSISDSMPGRIRTDASGRVVLLFPWDAELVRLTPTP
jgi:hypothetical protein